MWQPVDVQTGTPIKLNQNNFPVLIHGAPKSGASFFTIALMADLIRRGEPAVLLCAKGEGIRGLQKELDLDKPAVKYGSVDHTAATNLADMQLVTLFKRRGVDLLTSLRALTDFGRRVIVIQNVEELLSPAMWAVVKAHPRLLLSGNFSKLKLEIDSQSFSTTILFSESPGHWHHQRADLPNYIGDGLVQEKKHQFIVQKSVIKKLKDE